MSDELESMLADGLRHRAQQVGVRTHGFGDVRRRVRRHRQRQMAAGLLPAVAGFGWIVARPIAHDPLNPGDGASGCGDTLPAWTGEPSTVPPEAPVVTDVNGNAYYVDSKGQILRDANGTPVPVSAPMGTTTTYPLSTLPATTVRVDANGNPVPESTAFYDPQRDGTTTTTFGQEAASSTVAGTDVVATTVACENPTSLPPTETTAPNLMRVLVVNASNVGGAEMTTINSLFPGAAAASTGAQREETVVLLLNPDAETTAQYVAGRIGVDVKPLDRALATDEIGLVGVDLSEYDVVLVVGNTFANSFAGSPTTTSTIAMFADNSFVLFVNASNVNGAASAYASDFPGAQRANGFATDTSYVMTVAETTGAAQSIASRLGITDVRVGLDTSVLADQFDTTGIQVIVVIGQNHAVSLTSPTTVPPTTAG